MNCKNHYGIDASYACSVCGQPICLQCTVELNRMAYCKDCLEKQINFFPQQSKPIISKKKSKFFTFVFGCMPGAGHMYLGLINKGMSLMGIFFGMIFAALFLSDVLHVHWLQEVIITATVILSFFYSIFDALAAAEQINSGNMIKDVNLLGTIVELNFIKERIILRKKTIGYALVIIGGIGITNIFISTIDRIIRKFIRTEIPFSFSELIIPALLIIFGIYLLKKSRTTIDM